MANGAKGLAAQAKKLWEARDMAALHALRRKPGADKSPEVLYFLGLAYNASNQLREAIQCWRKASQLSPPSEDAIRALAFELADQAPVRAAELFWQLIGMRRANADDYACLGEICIKQGRLAEANQWLTRALELDPENSLALLALATLNVQMTNWDLALTHLRKVAALDDLDLTDLAFDPAFELLWDDPRFRKVVSPTGHKDARGTSRTHFAPSS